MLEKETTKSISEDQLIPLVILTLFACNIEKCMHLKLQLKMATFVMGMETDGNNIYRLAKM